jgi:hypothetical protein
MAASQGGSGDDCDDAEAALLDICRRLALLS